MSIMYVPFPHRRPCLNGEDSELSLLESPLKRSARAAKGSSSASSSSSLSPPPINECEGGPSSSEMAEVVEVPEATSLLAPRALALAFLSAAC